MDFLNTLTKFQNQWYDAHSTKSVSSQETDLSSALEFSSLISSKLLAFSSATSSSFVIFFSFFQVLNRNFHFVSSSESLWNSQHRSWVLVLNWCNCKVPHPLDTTLKVFQHFLKYRKRQNWDHLKLTYSCGHDKHTMEFKNKIMIQFNNKNLPSYAINLTFHYLLQAERVCATVMVCVCLHCMWHPCFLNS